MGDEPNAKVKVPNVCTYQIPQRASIHPDSRTVATEVGSRQEVCNNLPAEWIGPENGWRSSAREIRPRLCCRLIGTDVPQTKERRSIQLRGGQVGGFAWGFW